MPAPSQTTSATKSVLLTGATGYIGGRLLSALEADGVPIRCIARRPDHLRQRVAASTEVVQADALDETSIRAALEGVDTAYYLIHSMGTSGSFEAQDRKAARLFGAAARDAGLRKIIYLGGLGEGQSLSPHLESRHEVGEILRMSGVPTIELRASVVIGSGSLSFEIIRALVDRLPVMITPKWVRARAQPIAVEDVVNYLRQSLDLDAPESLVVEIGGADRVSYGDLMREYARQRGLSRVMISVPVLTPHLSSLWLGLITPVYARVGRELVESLRHETVVHNVSAQRLFDIRPMGIEAAIDRALKNEDKEFALTRWSDAISSKPGAQDYGGTKFGSRLVDSRVTRVSQTPELAFLPIERIGGKTGWYYANFLWRLRGWLDLLVGGAGLRRGRRDPEHLKVGDHVDFWRVEQIEPGRLLQLSAEMKLPGRAWLQFEVEPDGDDGGSLIRQTALFDPFGVAGLAYWYGLWPLHNLIFGRMLQAISKQVAA